MGKNSKQSTCRINNNRQKGFSFLEIMIVVVIMAGIVAIVGPSLFGKLDEAKIDQAKIQMKSLLSAFDLYHLDNTVYPSTDQGLESLISAPEVGIPPKNWRGPYLRSSNVPKDPWGNDFFYESDGSTITMKCLGADGMAGGQGINEDITLD